MRIVMIRNVWLLWFKYEMFLKGACMNSRYPASWTLLWSYRKFRRWSLWERVGRLVPVLLALFPICSWVENSLYPRIAMMLVLLTDRAKPSHTKLSHPKVFLSGVWQKRRWNEQIKWRSPETTLCCYFVFATQKENQDFGHAQWRLLVSHLWLCVGHRGQYTDAYCELVMNSVVNLTYFFLVLNFSFLILNSPSYYNSPELVFHFSTRSIVHKFVEPWTNVKG